MEFISLNKVFQYSDNCRNCMRGMHTYGFLGTTNTYGFNSGSHPRVKINLRDNSVRVFRGFYLM